MSKTGKYIYGIINSNEQNYFGPLGITACEGVYPHTKNFRVGVYIVSSQDVSAVVSDSEIVDYTYMPKNALAKLLVRHQKVIEKIMSRGYAIIPMKLGTFAVDEAELTEILNKGYSLIKDILEKINDKIEIDVVATWGDFNSVIKRVGEEKEIKEFKERLLTNSKGITIEDQMKVGVMVKKALDKKRENYANEIQNALKTVSEGLKGHDHLMDDEMVANFAFLINKTNVEDFDRKVEELNTEFTEKLNFKCVGPLPPYSFYTLEIKKMKFEEIDWARKKLRLLNDFTSKDEIKSAYHRLALSSHPDRSPDTPGIEKEFDEVNKAYKILFDYCRAFRQAGEQNICSLNEEEFKKNAVLVKVRE